MPFLQCSCLFRSPIAHCCLLDLPSHHKYAQLAVLLIEIQWFSIAFSIKSKTLSMPPRSPASPSLISPQTLHKLMNTTLFSSAKPTSSPVPEWAVFSLALLCSNFSLLSSFPYPSLCNHHPSSFSQLLLPFFSLFSQLFHFCRVLPTPKSEIGIAALCFQSLLCLL